jgi:hypothetical protein
MKASITARAVFAIPQFTSEQIAMLIKLSELHYDATCRAASREAVPRGFLRIWEKLSDRTEHFFIETPILAEWSELDLSLKMMEGRFGLSEEELKLKDTLSLDFSILLLNARRAIDLWKVEVDTDK